jgi:hypothetical protein
MVSNLAYTRWSAAYPLIQDKIQTIEDSFREEIKYLDEQLSAQYDVGNLSEMVRLATAFSVQSGDRLHNEWMGFYGVLFARLRDFYIIEEDSSDPICNCKVGEQGFSEVWKERIVEETGTKYKCEGDDSVPDMVMTKLRGFNAIEGMRVPNDVIVTDKMRLKAMK